MQLLCVKCGFLGDSKRIVRSNFAVELLVWVAALIGTALGLWLLLLVAAGFTLWRAIGSFDGCPKCEQSGMIPADSPVARHFIAGLPGKGQ